MTRSDLRALVRETRKDSGPAAAEPLQRQLLEELESAPGRDEQELLDARLELGLLLFLQDRFSEAAEVERRALEDAERLFGPDSPPAVDACLHLASSLYSGGRLLDAEALATVALERAERSRDGFAFERVGSVLRLLGLITEASGELARSEALHRLRHERELAHEPRNERLARRTACHWAWSLVNLRRVAAAREAFTFAANGKTANPELMLGLGLCDALDTGDFSAVGPLFERYRDALGPEDAAVLARVQRRVERHAAA